MSLRLLAVGDMHLGRRPSRLPEDLGDQARDLSPAGAWERLVARAIEEGVDVVALAGDVVEREDDFYEAYRELSGGVARLAEAGIRVVGVAGNHDVRVLPRLVTELADFELIGQEGEWQAWTMEQGAESLTLWGWSFPREKVPHSPLAGQAFERRPGVNLGLLHCDRDQMNSDYGPVSSSELRAAGLDGWLLGHIHVPDALTVDNPSGYLGSVSGMDPGEPGDHGPWLLTIERGRIQSLSQWVLAPLRWEPLALDITGLPEAEEARAVLTRRLAELDRRLADCTLPPRAVGLRLRLTGRTGLGEAVLKLLDSERGVDVRPAGSQTHYFIEKVASGTEPEIPLEALAERSDPPGLLAQRLLLLDRPEADPDRRQLIATGRRRLQARLDESRWRAVETGPLDDAAVEAYLRESGTRLLEQLLAQQGERSAA